MQLSDEYFDEEGETSPTTVMRFAHSPPKVDLPLSYSGVALKNRRSREWHLNDSSFAGGHYLSSSLR